MNLFTKQKQWNNKCKSPGVGVAWYIRGMVMWAEERKAGDRSEKYEGQAGRCGSSRALQ